MSSIVEDAAKTIWNLHKLVQQTRTRFQTKLRLENSLFVQKLQGNFSKTEQSLKICFIVIVTCVIFCWTPQKKRRKANQGNN